jgi:non-heme chloroperoxidase
VPIGNAYRSAELIANATLKEYSGAPHAMIATAKDQVNDDLLAFIKGDSKVERVEVALTAGPEV